MMLSALASGVLKVTAGSFSPAGTLIRSDFSGPESRATLLPRTVDERAARGGNQRATGDRNRGHRAMMLANWTDSG